MPGGPILEVNLEKIRENTSRVVDKCEQHGIEVLGVTKGFSAIPQIVSAMLHGGVHGLADARLENIIALRRKGLQEHITMLRIPRLSKAHLVVSHASASVNSEMVVINALSHAAQDQRTTHQVILMIDVGDLREGVLPENALNTAKRISRLRGIDLVGLGTNMGCFGGILPTTQNLTLLNQLSKDIEYHLGSELSVVSGGGTSTLLLIENGAIPNGINQVRIGEGILLGTDTTHNREISWLHHDAFILKAEVIEVKAKPSMPSGQIGLDAFGNKPTFIDRGVRKRAIVALGRQDATIEGLIPIDEKMITLGASSDHMIIDVNDTAEKVKVGSQILFRPTYSGLLSLSSSKYVKKLFRGGKEWSNWYKGSTQNSSSV